MCGGAYRRERERRGFSIIELVIVIMILGVISAIAVPRLSRAGESSKENAVIANVAILQSAIDRYTAEHEGLSPGHDAPGVVSTSGADFSSRLVGVTLDNGAPGAGGIFGPYLRQIPSNPYNGLRTVRIGGAAAGAGTHGWRFDPVSIEIRADHVLVLAGGGGVGSGDAGAQVSGGAASGGEIGGGGQLIGID